MVLVNPTVVILDNSFSAPKINFILLFTGI